MGVQTTVAIGSSPFTAMNNDTLGECFCPLLCVVWLYNKLYMLYTYMEIVIETDTL